MLQFTCCIEIFVSCMFFSLIFDIFSPSAEKSKTKKMFKLDMFHKLKLPYENLLLTYTTYSNKNFWFWKKKSDLKISFDFWKQIYQIFLACVTTRTNIILKKFHPIRSSYYSSYSSHRYIYIYIHMYWKNPLQIITF